MLPVSVTPNIGLLYGLLTNLLSRIDAIISSDYSWVNNPICYKLILRFLKPLLFITAIISLTEQLFQLDQLQDS